MVPMSAPLRWHRTCDVSLDRAGSGANFVFELRATYREGAPPPAIIDDLARQPGIAGLRWSSPG